MNDNQAHLLNLSEKVSEVSEVLKVDSAGRRAEIRNNGMVILSDRNDISFGLRLVRNGRTGVAGATEMADTSDLVDMAIADARTGPEENLELPSSVESADVVLFDDTLEKLDGSALASLLLQVRENLHDKSPHASVAGYLELERRRISLVNSAGLSCSYRKLLLDWRLRFTFPTGDGFFTTGISASSGQMRFDPYDIAARAATLGNWAGRIGGTPESCEAVFLPGALSVLLQAVRAGVSGRSLVGGSSPLTGHVGSSVCSEKVSITDTPLLDCGASSAPFDAEGVATFDKPLFERGVFRGFIFDLVTARESGTSSTGNAGRNLDRRPEPVCTNLVMEPGTASLDSMISSADPGIMVSDILSGEGSNASTGEFAFANCNTFRIEGGEITGRIPGAHIRGNVYSLLESVSMVEENLTESGSDLFPTVLTGGVSIRQ